MLGKRVVVQHIPLGGLLEWGVSSSSRNMPESQDSTTATDAPWATVANAPLSINPHHLPLPTVAALSRTYRPGVDSTTHGFLPSQPFAWASQPPQRTQASDVLTPGQVPLGPLASTNLRPWSVPGLPRARTTASNNTTIPAPLPPHDQSTDKDAS